MNLRIRTLIILFLANRVVVQSWGITQISVNNTIINFAVSGRKYIGKVKIVYEKDCYMVVFEGDSPKHYNSEIDVLNALDNYIKD